MQRAAAHLRDEIATDAFGRSVLAVVWTNGEADLKRGAAGEAVWTRGKPAHWSVIRIHPKETKNLTIRQIDQFSVITEWPESMAPNAEFSIDYVNGELIVI